MVYVKNSPLRKIRGMKKNKIMSRMGSLSQEQKKRLKKHRQSHINRGNPPTMLNKHMRVMNQLMRQGMSFEMAHKEAQREYPMNIKFINDTRDRERYRDPSVI